MSYQNDIGGVNRNLELLAPKLKEAVKFCIAECRQFNVHVFEAWRSPERQLKLYNQGRTAPGKKVTNAYPMFSMHQYGLSVDCAFKDKNNQWTWEGPWDEVTKIFLKNGFDKPPTFEKAHFQMSEGFHISAIKDLTDKHTLLGMWQVIGLA